MAQTSFRDILSQFLEEESALPEGQMSSRGESSRHSAIETPSFHWQPNRSTSLGTKTKGYPRTSQTTAAKVAEPKRVVVEPKWAIASLSPQEQKLIQNLRQLGATEIGLEISAGILKKAYRRLARQLHPDAQKAGAPSSQEGFLKLQSIYEELGPALKARAEKEKSSGSACGNESASEPGSRHQDAA